MKKTYSVYGLLEWQHALSAEGAKVRIKFSGGNMGPTVVRPATFTTENPAIQHLIEKSKEFKSGKIALYRIEK